MAAIAVPVAVPVTFRGFLQIDREEEAPQAETPAEKSCLDKVKEIGAYVLIALGAFLLLGAMCLFISCSAAAYCPQDLTSVQILFTSGLSAVLAGFTLKNGNYGSELKFSDSKIPFSYTCSLK